MGRQSFSSAFALILRRERVAKGLSQERLAHRAGLHRTYVGLIERGQRKPTIEVGYALAQALGVSLWELVREAEKRGR
jgi:transcriptional regulator with XRE-family HTH domain